MSRVAILAGAAELAAGRPYAERAELRSGLHDRIAGFLLDRAVKPAVRRLRPPARRIAAILPRVNAHEAALAQVSDAELVARFHALRRPLRQDGFTREIAGECFAMVREAASRVLGKRHYNSQLMGGWCLLDGKLVEMETGEGKTFACTLPACTVALTGFPVHIITVNDYLARRDAEEMGPLYRFLGLSVGVVAQGMPRSERRIAYAQSITYCTNKELAFDYLRDKVAAAQRASRLHFALNRLSGDNTRQTDLVLRGLYFGIVDEADSVFIDEARTPLILSSSVGAAEESALCTQALSLARELMPGKHHLVDLVERSVSITPAGKAYLRDRTADLEGVWTSVRAREELVTQAITALLLFRRDEHYVVSDGKVQIVDESTGRVMPDRAWERGLHQLIEIKEGCDPTDRRETLARLTYQRLFRRYIRLAGMTGTAREVAAEVKSVYGLDVVRIPLHRPSRRHYHGVTICRSRTDKWSAVADRVEQMALVGRRPVLIGTRSVGASEEISALLHRRGIAHALLNAKQDQSEADIIAEAGQIARVTVATNMAGRGTDIRLGDSVAERGGLHVILTEFHEARRIDRQLFGRCARQGDPGSCEAIIAFDDDIYTVYAPRLAIMLRRLHKVGRTVPDVLHDTLRGTAQAAAERRAARVRVENLSLDRRLDQMLAFSGRSE